MRFCPVKQESRPLGTLPSRPPLKVRRVFRDVHERSHEPLAPSHRTPTRPANCRKGRAPGPSRQRSSQGACAVTVAPSEWAAAEATRLGSPDLRVEAVVVVESSVFAERGSQRGTEPRAAASQPGREPRSSQPVQLVAELQPSLLRALPAALLRRRPAAGLVGREPSKTLGWGWVGGGAVTRPTHVRSERRLLPEPRLRGQPRPLIPPGRSLRRVFAAAGESSVAKDGRGTCLLREKHPEARGPSLAVRRGAPTTSRGILLPRPYCEV